MASTVLHGTGVAYGMMIAFDIENITGIPIN